MNALPNALRILDHLKRLFPWTLPLKFIASSLLIALGGAGFLGYLSEYATYCFAIYYGFRAPVEGIPYLKATVAFGSFFLLLTGGFFFVGSVMFVRAVFWSFENFVSLFRSVSRRLPGTKSFGDYDFRRTVERMSARPFWLIFLSALLVACLGGLIGYFEAKWIARIDPSSSIPPIYLSIGCSIYGFVLTLSMVYRAAAWWLAGAATAFYFLGCIFVMFSPSRYAEFLRIVGFGGGAPVMLVIADENVGKVASDDYFLMLRTNDAFLLLSKDKSLVVELPKDRVKAITYSSDKAARL